MSGEVFFIADTHFSHKGILEFSKTKPFRDFDTIEEHDEALVHNWNQMVGPKDKVWHLGDAVFGKRNLPILGRLNGRKRLVMGNHDIYGADEYLKYFSSVWGCVEFNGMILSHIPLDKETNHKRFFLNIHGHMHTDKIEDNWHVCVSVEQLGLRPIPLDEIYNLWAKDN
jgi:calcineurin-like phosphoesterase family protein